MTLCTMSTWLRITVQLIDESGIHRPPWNAGTATIARQIAPAHRYGGAIRFHRRTKNVRTELVNRGACGLRRTQG
jgi:hypothetical protein